MKMEDRVAVVTGAAQGIGAAVARKLDAEGAKVVIADLNGDGAQKVASGLRDAVGLEVDISSESDATAMINDALERYGRVDSLVNNASIVPFTPWDEVDFAEWRRLLSVNLDGTYLACRAAQKPMREAGYGRIVNVVSNTIMAGTPNMAHYVAAKAGVMGFTRALATELGSYGITVNAVAPGLTATEGTLDSPHKDAFDFVQGLQAIPRRGEPDDIAPAVVFLASEEAGWVTGSTVVVDGGHTRH